MVKYDRITIDPDEMSGVPCIRNLRMPVATLVRYIAKGWTRERVLKEFPELEPADIDQALEYAADALRERELPRAG